MSLLRDLGDASASAILATPERVYQVVHPLLRGTLPLRCARSGTTPNNTAAAAQFLRRPRAPHSGRYQGINWGVPGCWRSFGAGGLGKDAAFAPGRR